nr:thioesterase family protein [Virgibacillus ndiopensis]
MGDTYHDKGPGSEWKLEIKVRVSETDMLGHINNASYFTYMEVARLDFLQKLGIDVSNSEFTIMLVSAKCDFIRQGYFGQILDIKTTVQKIGRTSFTLGSEMSDKKSGNMIAKGEVTIVYFDILNQKPAQLPEAFKVTLQDHMHLV